MGPARRGPRLPSRSRRVPMGTGERSRARFAYWLIAPAVAFMVLVHLIPTAAGMFLSLLNLNTFTFQQLFGAPWAGLENYNSILFDSANPLHSGFTNAVGNTAFYTVWTVGLTLVLGLAIALLLNRSFPGNRVVRTLMLTPWVVPSFVVASLWQFMWQRDAGIINKLLVDYMGILDERPTWLLGENTMWAIIIPSVWRGIPFAMLIFIAGLQAIPPELHEAAAIDGAGPWKRFRHITLPLLRPLIAIQLLFGVIYSAYQFAIPYIMLGSNPGPSADLLMTLIIRQSFSNNLFGYGAAVSTLLMAAMFVWVLIWYRAFRRDLQEAR
ncbi:MAG TPA: sugar ABC transporter permease [Thermoleophilaceae bacterium]